MRRLWTKRGSRALLIGSAGGFPARVWTGEALKVFLFFNYFLSFVFLSLLSRVPARRSRLILAFCVFARLPCVVFYCPPLQRAASSVRRAHRLLLHHPPSPPSSLLLTLILPLPFAPSCVSLNGAVHPGYCSASPGRVS